MAQYSIVQHDPEGITELDMDTKSLQWLMDNGYAPRINGNYVLHRINLLADQDTLIRLAYSKGMAGFTQLCDVYNWAACRYLASLELAAGNITQGDYDLVDGILPI